MAILTCTNIDFRLWETWPRQPYLPTKYFTNRARQGLFANFLVTSSPESAMCIYSPSLSKMRLKCIRPKYHVSKSRPLSSPRPVYICTCICKSPEPLQRLISFWGLLGCVSELAGWGCRESRFHPEHTYPCGSPWCQPLSE